MQYKNSFSFIIGYRHKNDRLRNLRRVIDWVNSFSGSQVILVEQDTHSKISNLNINCKHIFIKSEMPYNRSWAFNVGLKYTNSNIIVFGDSDIIIEPNNFINALNKIKEFDVVSPYDSVVDLTPQENNLPLRKIVNIDRPGRGENDNQKINICGGIVIFRKEAILNIGGWSEDFIGWGGEDDFQAIKVKNFLTHTETNNKCYHFYHKKIAPDDEYYKKSLFILNKVKKMDEKSLRKMIERSKQKIGMLNKYE